MSKYLREFYHSIRMTTSSFTTHSSFSNRASEIVCKHSESAFITISTFAIISTSDFLFFSFVFCDHVSDDHSMTQNLKTLYSMHLIENAKALRCNWFTQIKKTQKTYHLRKHELQMKSKIKQKAKKLMKQQEKIRLVKKRAKKYTCRRCKTIKFDSNIKFHEHIRTRHAKKSKSAQQSVEFVVSSAFESKFFSSSRSIIFSSFSSSKLLSFSMFTSEIVRERSESVSLATFSSEFLSISTSKKPIFWAEIVSRSVVASKSSRFPIATSKSMCKFLKNANIACSSTSSRIFSSKSSRFYLIVNDLFHMFAEKPNSFDLQPNQNKSLFFRNFDKCNFVNKCDLIQRRITSYFNAIILSAFKSIKFEAFSAMHASIKQSSRISSSRIFRFSFSSMRIFFSTFSRSFPVCRHCQERFVIYWLIDWIMPNVSKVENNEIFMRQRYWSFASLRSTLKKYWFFYSEKVTTLTLKKLTCCLFVVCPLTFLVNRWSIWEN